MTHYIADIIIIYFEFILELNNLCIYNMYQTNIYFTEFLSENISFKKYCSPHVPWRGDPLQVAAQQTWDVEPMTSVVDVKPVESVLF